MHVQNGVPQWTDALSHMPDGGLVLSVSDGGTLVEAKHANPKLITAYRHFFADQQFSGDYPTAVEIARHNFETFIDRTYLEQYMPFVDLVLEYNEYYDQGMALNDPAALQEKYITAKAHANVWNEEYRGRVVHSDDGGEGLIPASCKLVIGNSPVGNDIPKQFAELAISTDNVLGYHPYQRASVTQWPGIVRDPGCWQYHSGRWHFQEQAWGLKPLWCFTETMPYMGSAEGWRHASVLAGNQALLVDIFRRWLLDVAQTPAYLEGRILGPGAWFTVGGGGSWFDYLLEAPQLIALADAARELWHPGTGEDDMLTAQTKAEVKVHADAIKVNADGILALLNKWWLGKPVPFVVLAKAQPLTTYKSPGGPVAVVIPNATWDINVTAVSGDYFLVSDPPGTDKDLYVKAADVKLKGT